MRDVAGVRRVPEGELEVGKEETEGSQAQRRQQMLQGLLSETSPQTPSTPTEAERRRGGGGAGEDLEESRVSAHIRPSGPHSGPGCRVKVRTNFSVVHASPVNGSVRGVAGVLE